VKDLRFLRCDAVLLAEKFLTFQSSTFSSSSRLANPHGSFFTEMKAPHCLLILETAYVTTWGYISEDENLPKQFFVVFCSISCHDNLLGSSQGTCMQTDRWTGRVVVIGAVQRSECANEEVRQVY